MRKIKLLLAAMAALVGLSAQAQSWTASEVGAGNFVLYNVGKGQFLTAGNAYSTQASITTTGVIGSTQVELIANGGNWFIRTGVGNTNYGLENLAASGDVYMDQSRNKQSTWTFTQVTTDNGPVYNIVSAENHGGGSGAYLTANADNTIVSDNGTAESAYAQWKLLSATTAAVLKLAEDYNSVKATIVAWTTSPNVTEATAATSTFNTALGAADAKVEAATTEAEINEAIADLKAAGNTFLENVVVVGGIDITNAWITNPAPYANGNGWTLSAAATFDSGNQCAEYWNKSGATIKQTLANLPKGAYRLTAIALTRTGRVATLSAGSASKSIVTIDDGTVNSRAQANSWFNNGNGVNELDFTLDEATASLEIGLTADNATADYWMVWRSFSLTYFGDPLNLGKAALAEAVAAAEALEGTIPSGVYTDVAAVVTANNKAYATVAEYEDATAAIVEATNNAKVLQASYTRYTTIKTAAKAVATGLDTTTPDAAVNAATTADAITAAIASLRAAFLAELPNVTIPNDPGYLDVTAVMVDNASVSANVEYWTYNKEGGTGPTTNYGETEFYNANFKFYQTLALTPGTWEFGVTGFHRAGNHSTYFYAGDDKILIPGVESSVVNTMAAAETYFDGGNGKVALKFLVEAAGNIEIGINNQDTETDKWTIFRDFTLKYYGAPDYSVYEEEWTNLVADATTAKTTYASVTGTELTALNEAIADTPEGSNLKATYTAKISALQTALATFNAAGPSYNAYVDYKNVTVALWGTDFEVAAPTTAAAAVTAVNALKVAQYNKVATDYKYPLTGKIGEFSTWTKEATSGGEPDTPQTLSTEHFRGNGYTYYEQGKNGWASNSFTVDYSKTATLPAGNYVIKVATRASGNVTGTVSATATANTVAIANVGAASKGITTSGVASFDEGEFAKDGIGYGWEWRFLPFTVAVEGEVTITIHAESSSVHGWVSIADAELLSDADKSTKVDYDETANNTIEDVDVATVTVTRTIKEGFNTVCLPFSLTAGQVATAFGTGSEVYTFSENSADPMDATINFNKGDGSITANVPVLVKATSASAKQTFEGVQIVAPTADAKVEGKNFDFVGVYAPQDIDEGDWFLNGSDIYKATDKTQGINAFRAYFQAKSEVPSVKLYIEGIETSISSINGLQARPAGVIYNLAGQRMQKAQKGINIVNGKKVVIR